MTIAPETAKPRDASARDGMRRWIPGCNRMASDRHSKIRISRVRTEVESFFGAPMSSLENATAFSFLNLLDLSCREYAIYTDDRLACLERGVRHCLLLDTKLLEHGTVQDLKNCKALLHDLRKKLEEKFPS